jgi:hypothetical protein
MNRQTVTVTAAVTQNGPLWTAAVTVTVRVTVDRRTCGPGYRALVDLPAVHNKLLW